jgi:hypothetical protein
MKIRIKIIIIVLLFICLRSYSQDYSSNQINNPNILPPDVSGFQKVNFLPVSNYTGRANIDIPFYNIDLGGLKIPVGLSYNTGGVKPNDVASSVGLNWSLNAGGMIYKSVKGIDDFKSDLNYFINEGTQGVTDLGSKLGWLSYYTKHPFDLGILSADIPDVFSVSAPNLNLSFIHNRTHSFDAYGNTTPFTGNYIFGTDQNGIHTDFGDNSPLDGFPFILDGDESYKIDEVYGDMNLGATGVNTGDTGVFYPDYSVYGINSISIKTLDGFQYVFDKIDSSQYTYESDVANPERTGLRNTLKTNNNLVAYNITRIIDLKTNKFVEFQYEVHTQFFSEIIDNYVTFQGASIPISLGGGTNQKGLSQTYPKLNRLKKIIFDEGYFDFNYNLNRDDLPGEKPLTDITLFDKNNNQIKKLLLNFEYFQSSVQPTSPFSKRLKLKEVVVQGSNATVFEKYKLTYNGTALPLRIMAVTDSFGYNNGYANSFQYNILNNQYVINPPLAVAVPSPTYWFNPNNGQNSFLSEGLNSNAIYIPGNYSLNAELSFCKAGVLERIDYPLGGFITLEYELNSFKINNLDIQGGGLRVKEQKISDGTNLRVLKFDYRKIDGTSSGSVVSMPKNIDFDYTGPMQTAIQLSITPSQFNSWFSLYKTTYNKSNIELTNGAYVGYSRVKVFEDNKGYSIFNYSNPTLIPNTTANVIFDGFPNAYEMECRNTNNYKKIYFDNGKVDFDFDNNVFRGKLLSETVFNQQNELLKETLYNYTTKEYKSMLVIKHFDLMIANEFLCSVNNGPNWGGSFQYGYYKQRRFLPTNIVENEYFNGSIVTKTKAMTYDDNYSLVKTDIVNDNMDIYRNEYYYPFDNIVISDFGMSSLNLSNRKSEKVLTYNFKNNDKLLDEKILYNSFGSLTLPKQVKKYKNGSINNNNVINSEEITQRDNLGNILETSDNAGNKTSFIWGYYQTKIVAKFENASYSSLPTSLVTSIQTASNTGTEIQLLGFLGTIRGVMTNSLVSTYTYKPLVGVSTITDVKGDKITYNYDTFGRLLNVVDKNGNILTENEYHLKP